MSRFPPNVRKHSHRIINSLVHPDQEWKKSPYNLFFPFQLEKNK